jgi:hypothetical protein
MWLDCTVKHCYDCLVAGLRGIDETTTRGASVWCDRGRINTMGNSRLPGCLTSEMVAEGWMVLSNILRQTVRLHPAEKYV